MKWRYAATDLRTGLVLADTIPPLSMTQFQRTRGDSATASATLDLTGGATYLNLLKPRRTVVWALGDEQPYWGGNLWDRPHRSALDSTLSLSLSSIESLFARRRINDNLGFSGVDQLDIFRSIVTYALSKRYGEVANFTMDTTTKSGVTRDRTYLATDHANVLTVLQDLANLEDGFEWTIDPIWVSGSTLGWYLRFGYPTLGNDATDNIVLSFPSAAVADYAWPQTGSYSVNSTKAVGDTPTGGATQMISDVAHGVDQADLDADMPLLEDTKSYGGQGITDVATLNDHADQDVAVESGDTINPTFTLNNSVEPRLGRYQMGDTVMFSAVSNIHPAPGIQVSTRISSITVYPTSDGTSPEKVLLTQDAITDVEV